MILILYVCTNKLRINQVIVGPEVCQQVIRRPLADTPDFFASGLSDFSEGANHRAPTEDPRIVHPDYVS
jgi:hypothetical protein